MDRSLNSRLAQGTKMTPIRYNQTPEQKARDEIDRQLTAAGWGIHGRWSGGAGVLPGSGGT